MKRKTAYVKTFMTAFFLLSQNQHRTAFMMALLNAAVDSYGCWCKIKLIKNSNIPARITCSKSTIEIIEQGVKQLRLQNDINDIFLWSCFLTLNIFHTLSQYFYCWLWACDVSWQGSQPTWKWRNCQGI